VGQCFHGYGTMKAEKTASLKSDSASLPDLSKLEPARRAAKKPLKKSKGRRRAHAGLSESRKNLVRAATGSPHETLRFLFE